MSDDRNPIDTWTGEFGDEYTDRNMPDEKAIENRMRFWTGVFSTMPILPYNEPKSILEIGANVGGNLVALNKLYKMHDKTIDFLALEPNSKARQLLKQQDIDRLRIVGDTAQNIQLENASVDIVITCGVLIHVPPKELPKALSEIYRVSRRFIICAEYFSPEPREIKYRGEDGLLFTRDFGGTYLDQFQGLRCTGYSFAWKRFTGMDNITWWVFEKVN